jgi:hypothetical protein
LVAGSMPSEQTEAGSPLARLGREKDEDRRMKDVKPLLLDVNKARKEE